MEQHHIWPTHLGGAVDGPQVWLCGNCHSKIHYAALGLYNGKRPREDEAWLKRATPLITRIVRAMRQAENDPLDDAPARIIIKIDKNTLRRIHTRKRDRGYRSLQTYIMALISLDLPPI